MSHREIVQSTDESQCGFCVNWKLHAHLIIIIIIVNVYHESVLHNLRSHICLNNMIIIAHTNIKYYWADPYVAHMFISYLKCNNVTIIFFRVFPTRSSIHCMGFHIPQPLCVNMRQCVCLGTYSMFSTKSTSCRGRLYGTLVSDSSME